MTDTIQSAGGAITEEYADPVVDAIHAFILDRFAANGLQLKKQTKQIPDPSSALRHELFRAFNSALQALVSQIPRHASSLPVKMSVFTASGDEKKPPPPGRKPCCPI